MNSLRCFVGADWIAVESWLTAYHSGDVVLFSELREQLAGGVKVHARNAALIYGIDPADAKTHLVNLKGRMRPAYYAGKRLSHAWNYGMGPRQGARTFWLPEAFMATASAKLTEKYAGVTAWRRTLADRVYGQPIFRCPRCTVTADEDNDCASCSRSVGVPIPLRFSGYAVAPTHVERTAFGRHRLYEGRRRNGQNALAAQHPQSGGSSMWNITFVRLHGWDPVTKQPWPSPEGILRYDPHAPWNDMFKPAEVFVATGMYDSFYLECPFARRDEITQWLLWTMEQPWPELNGWRFPAEGMAGYNLGKFDYTDNPFGLRELTDVKPFTMAQDAGWGQLGAVHMHELPTCD